jgi:DNA-binding CsgD family transcriptional regulator
MAEDLLTRGLAQRDQELHVMYCWGRLSPREKQVAALLFHGETNRQIAARFHISPETVKTYVGRIFNKFGITSRAELKRLLLDEYGSGSMLDDPR